MTVPPASEAVEATRDGRALSVPFEATVNIWPTPLRRVRILVAIEAKFFRNVTPSAALRNEGKALDVDGRHARSLMVGELGVIAEVVRRFRKAAENISDGPPSLCRRGRDSEAFLQVLPHTNDDETLSGLRESVVSCIVEVRIEGVVAERREHLANVFTPALLAEDRDILENETPGSKPCDETNVVSYQVISVIAQMGAALLLREALARRTSRKEVEFTREHTGPLEKISDLQLRGVRNESLVAEVQTVRCYSLLVDVECGKDLEARRFQAEAHSPGARETFDRRVGTHGLSS
jgi:hypothetical protein